MSGWGLSPGSVLSSNIIRFSSSESGLWNSQQITKSLLSQINILLMVLNSTGNNKAFGWSNVVHHELLEKSSIEVIDVFGQSKIRHTKSVVSISSSQKEVLVGSEWVEFS